MRFKLINELFALLSVWHNFYSIWTNINNTKKYHLQLVDLDIWKKLNKEKTENSSKNIRKLLTSTRTERDHTGRFHLQYSKSLQKVHWMKHKRKQFVCVWGSLDIYLSQIFASMQKHAIDTLLYDNRHLFTWLWQQIIYLSNIFIKCALKYALI